MKNLITKCSWCEKYKVANIWTEPEPFSVLYIGLLNAEKEYRITHGVCEKCEDRIDKMLSHMYER